jgi:NAD(P)-dependent dehydrogenase (short-subunit alcohol dehydrogenase family)
MDLMNKTAIVTGAGGTIGRALALEFARSGARVVCAGRTESKLLETISIIEANGGTGCAVKADIKEKDDVQNMVELTLDRFGGIDLLFNAAGSFTYVGPVWEADPEEWWKDVTINLLGTMRCCHAVLPYMMEKNSGVIINMDGGGGSNGPNVGGSAYGCSKAAILRFSEGLARELEEAGSSVLVFCMMPGFVRSRMTEYLVETPEKEKWQKHVRPLMGTDVELPPDYCAKATMKLLGIASGELSGRIFYVDTDYKQVEREKARIQEDNLYVLHLVTLGGLLGPWPVPGEKG